MKTLFAILCLCALVVASAQTVTYQTPTNSELVGYQCYNRVQSKVTNNDGTTQTGLVFAECARGGGRGGNIWHNAVCASVIWDESGNLLQNASGTFFEITAPSNSRTVVPASWCFGTP